MKTPELANNEKNLRKRQEIYGTSNVSRNMKYQFKTRMIDRGSFIRTDDQWL
jgi:hypothetical protein